MSTSDKLRELAEVIEKANRDSRDGLSFSVPTLATLKEAVIVMQEAAAELDDWMKIVEYSDAEP